MSDESNQAYELELIKQKYTEKICILESSLKEYEVEITTLKQHNTYLNEASIEWSNKCNDANTLLLHANDEITHLKIELTNLQSLHDAQIEQINNTESVNNINEIEEINKKLIQYISENEQLQKENEKYLNQITELHNKLQEATTKCNDLNKTQIFLQDEWNASKIRTNELDHIIEEHVLELARLENENMDLKQNLCKIQNEKTFDTLKPRQIMYTPERAPKTKPKTKYFVTPTNHFETSVVEKIDFGQLEEEQLINVNNIEQLTHENKQLMEAKNASELQINMLIENEKSIKTQLEKMSNEQKCKMQNMQGSKTHTITYNNNLNCISRQTQRLIDEKTETINQMKIEYDLLLNKSGNVEKMLTEENTKNESLQQQITDIKIRNDTYKQQINKLQEDLNMKSEEIFALKIKTKASIEKHAKTCEELLNLSNDKMNELSEQNHVKTTELKQSIIKIKKELKNKQNEEDMNNNEYNLKVKQLNEELNNVKQQYDNKLGVLSQRINKYAENEKALNDEISAFTDENKGLMELKNKFEHDTNELNNKLKIYENIQQEQNNKLDELTNKYQELNTERNELTQQLNEQNTKYEQLLNKYNNIKNEKEEYKIQRNKSNENIKQIESELSNVKEKYNQQIEVLNNKQNELIEQKQQLEINNDEMNKKLQIYETSKSEQNGKMEQLMNKCNELKKEKKVLTESNDKYNMKLKEIESLNSELNAKVNKLNEKQKLSEYKLDTQRKRKTQLLHQYTELNKTLEQYKVKLNESNENVKQTESDLTVQLNESIKQNKRKQNEILLINKRHVNEIRQLQTDFQDKEMVINQKTAQTIAESEKHLNKIRKTSEANMRKYSSEWNEYKQMESIKLNEESLMQQKQYLTVFFATYSNSKNWVESAKENGIQKYVFKFAEKNPINVRMEFLYSVTLYLGQMVGINKRCLTHAFMLFKSVRSQIDTLCQAFESIEQTLEYHNNNKLWKYVYLFLKNVVSYFADIQRFVGMRTLLKAGSNSRKYSHI